MAARVLVIDNYDSFVYNLVQYLGQLGVDAEVWRNDDERLTDLPAVVAEYDGILLSPGPGTPQRAGATMPIIPVAAAAGTPLLGVCLGHQAIGAAFGARITGARRIMHGKTSPVRHEGRGLYAGIQNPFAAGRYHSLAVDRASLPPDLLVEAVSDDGEIMGLRHRRHATFGIQFHPESVLTPCGKQILRNFLTLCAASTPAPTSRESAHAEPPSETD